MAETNFKVFAERASASELPTDEAYLSDEVRLGGNKAGSIARSAPNNKALKQATLAAAALAEYTALHSDESITDELSAEQLTEKVNQAITAHIDTDTTNSTKLVHIGGDETITGLKTFSALPESGVTPIKDQQFVTKKYSDDQDKEVLKAAKEYTDIEVSNALQEAKDYADKLSDETLQAAKDYTDKQLADGGGAGGTGGAVLAPNIISPANGAEDVIITTAFTASEFRSAYAENTRTTRQFQVTKTTWDECEIDVEINADAYSPLERLEANHDYKWRCRDKSSFGITSPWSTEAAFETGGELFVNQPVIEVEGGTSDIKETPLLNGSIFSVNQGEDTHQATDWRIKRTSDGTIVWQSQNDTEHLTSIEVPSGYLRTSTQYTAEVRYKGTAYNWSKWSTPVTFTTSNVFDSIQAPTVSITGEPSNVSATPTISGSAFTVITEQGTVDTHEATDWLIKQGGRTVWQSLNNTSNKESITVPRGTLSTSTAYTAEVRYKGAKLGYSAYGSKAFNTKAQFPAIAAPSLTVTGTPDSVPETPTLTASSFTISNGDEGQQDTHQLTDWLVMDELGTSEVWSSKNDTTNKTTITLPKGILHEGTKYQFKVRYKGAELGWSQYTTVEGTTKAKFAEIKAPVVTLTDDLGSVFSRFVADTTGFFPLPDASESGKKHVSTTWKLYESSNLSTPVWEVINDTVNREEIGVDYKLTPSTAYTLTCQFNGENGTVSEIATVEFTSAEIPSSYIDITLGTNAEGETLKDVFYYNQSGWSYDLISQFDVYINGAKQEGVYFNDASLTLHSGQNIVVKHKLKNDVLYPAVTIPRLLKSLNKPYPRFSFSNGITESEGPFSFQAAIYLTKVADAPFRFISGYTISGNKDNWRQTCVFDGCRALTSLPNFMFIYVGYISNGLVNFANNTAITSIPSKLFRHNTKVSDFFISTNSSLAAAFQDCKNLRSVPSKLLEPVFMGDGKTSQGYPSIASFFAGCTSLTSIPSDLFGDAIQVPISMEGMFSGCTKLTNVPINTFANLQAPSGGSSSFSISLRYLFLRCSSLTPNIRFRFRSTYVRSEYNVQGFAEGCKAKGTVYVPDATFKTYFDSASDSNVNAIVEG